MFIDLFSFSRCLGKRVHVQRATIVLSLFDRRIYGKNALIFFLLLISLQKVGYLSI